MSRIGLTLENAFAESFKKLRRDIEEIKAAQRIGHDILEPKLIECLDINGDPTVYDVVADSGAFISAGYLARFQADHQDKPWATPHFKVMYGDPDTPATPEQYNGLNLLYTDDFYNVAGRVSYRGRFVNNVYGNTTTLYLKVYFLATDTGTLTVTEIDPALT